MTQRCRLNRDGHISFAFGLTTCALCLTLVPAIIVWLLLANVMARSLDELQRTSMVYVTNHSRKVHYMLISNALQSLSARTEEAERQIQQLVAFVKSHKWDKLDLRPGATNPQMIFDACNCMFFDAVKGHPYFSYVGIAGVYIPIIQHPLFGFDRNVRIFWVVDQALQIDIVTRDLSFTVYRSHLSLSPDLQWGNWKILYLDQTTGKTRFALQNDTLPVEKLWAPAVVYGYNGWDSDIVFNQYSGQVNIGRVEYVLAQNSTMLELMVNLDLQAISAELLEHVKDSPSDRLFLVSRDARHGHMVAASHGKFFSHSDIDTRHMFPVDISNYKRFTCANSSDLLISQACQEFFKWPRKWNIPEGHFEMTLNNTAYWVAVAYMPPKYHLGWAMVLLKNRATVMQGIEGSLLQVGHHIVRQRTLSYIMLVAVSCVSVVLSLLVSHWLGQRLSLLARNMDRVITLDFAMLRHPWTVFTELQQFQASFNQMIRGLRAFRNFVPQDVVQLIMIGRMQITQPMTQEQLTIMFADTEGFTEVFANMSPEASAEMAREHFEIMCNNVIQNHGTIDKFIGDCIMAFWGAPHLQLGNARDAILAALAMQRDVYTVHSGRQAQGQPTLHFSLGIHSGVCLLGFLGCSYRISYTCLGDSVNVASRLQSLNKRFGTYLCISYATYEQTREHFHFRYLSRVTVPGRSEILPVYEILCAKNALEEQPNVPQAQAPPPALPAMANGSPRYLSPVVRPVIFHWSLVARATLLRHCQAYESAYNDLVAGLHWQARETLSAPPLDMPDAAWDLLKQLCMKQVAPGAPAWDGVFYFNEK